MAHGPEGANQQRAEEIELEPAAQARGGTCLRCGHKGDDRPCPYLPNSPYPNVRCCAIQPVSKSSTLSSSSTKLSTRSGKSMAASLHICSAGRTSKAFSTMS